MKVDWNQYNTEHYNKTPVITIQYNNEVELQYNT